MPPTDNNHLLTLLLASPVVGSAVLLVVTRLGESAARAVALVASAVATAAAWWIAAAAPMDAAGLTDVVRIAWAPSLGVEFLLGIDGLSRPMIVLAATLTLIAVLATQPRGVERPRLYYALLMLLLAGVLGVFLALDFVLFYVFWELILAPMYLLIALWGGPKRKQAALKFVLYTLAGGVLILAGGLLLYGYSDLTGLSSETLARCGVVGAPGPDAQADVAAWLDSDTASAARFAAADAADRPLRTFNLLALAAVGQETDAYSAAGWLGRDVGWWAFVLLLVGLAIKLPAAPLHTWLPDAHTEAPTPVSMLLAGVLLKLGGYGMLRVAWAACPAAAAELATLIAVVGVVGLFWGALAAMAQTDFKRLVAYSSVSHMGYLLVGLAAGATAEGWRADLWTLGATGAVFQMVAHGVTSAGMFFAVGVLYDRVHHRDLTRLGGLMNRMPIASGTAIVLAMASLGLPGLCGFVGELLVLVAAWPLRPVLTGVAVGVTVLTAAYTLRAVRLAYFGRDYRGPHADRLTPLTPRELIVAGTLTVASVALGVRPAIVTSACEPTVAAQGTALATASPVDAAPIAFAKQTASAQPGRAIVRRPSSEGPR